MKIIQTIKNNFSCINNTKTKQQIKQIAISNKELKSNSSISKDKRYKSLPSSIKIASNHAYLKQENKYVGQNHDENEYLLPVEYSDNDNHDENGYLLPVEYRDNDNHDENEYLLPVELRLKNYLDKGNISLQIEVDETYDEISEQEMDKISNETYDEINEQEMDKIYNETYDEINEQEMDKIPNETYDEIDEQEMDKISNETYDEIDEQEMDKISNEIYVFSKNKPNQASQIEDRKYLAVHIKKDSSKNNFAKESSFSLAKGNAVENYHKEKIRREKLKHISNNASILHLYD